MATSSTSPKNGGQTQDQNAKSHRNGPHFGRIIVIDIPSVQELIGGKPLMPQVGDDPLQAIVDLVRTPHLNILLDGLYKKLK